MPNELVKYNHIKHHWLREHSRSDTLSDFAICNHLVCKDGFTMSVQASGFHYCEPREYLPSGDYTQWEVMPMDDEPLFSEYMDSDVASFVPTDVVNNVIEAHGGLSGVSRMIKL